MYQGIRPLVTSGIALVGAGVIAVSPVTVPPPEVQVPSLPATQHVVEMSNLQLAGLAEDLARFVDAVVNVPGSAIQNYDSALEMLRLNLDNASSTRQVLGALGLGLGQLYSAPIRALLDPLVVNVPPQDAANQWDLIDAALLTIRDLADDPLNLPLIPADLLFIWGFGYSPAQAATLIATGYLVKPLVLAYPFVAALANMLPAPFGGDIFAADADTQGLIFSSYWRLYAGAQSIIGDLVGPPEQQQMIQAKETITAVKVADDPGNLALDDVRRVGAYLEQGRPLDAVRLLASHALMLPTELVSIPVSLGAAFLPPPVGGVLDPSAPAEERGLAANGYIRSVDVVSSRAARIGPQTNVDDINNAGAKKDADDPATGNQVVKGDNDPPRAGANARAVVKEVRNGIRQTIKDVRQGVRDVVKSVTGLGKKKEAKTEANNETPKPAE